MKKLPKKESTPVSRLTASTGNKERRANRLEREAIKNERRKTTPRGTARKNRRRQLQALWVQDQNYRNAKVA